MNSNRKQEIRNIIKRMKDELRVKRIKGFIIKLLVYSAIPYMWFFMDEDFLTGIFSSLITGAIFCIVSSILWLFVQVDIYEADKRLQELEEEYDDLNY